jgi:hypothetical protein
LFAGTLGYRTMKILLKKCVGAPRYAISPLASGS